MIKWYKTYTLIAKHIYYVKGEKVPSVSDLLKPIDLVALENIPPQYLAIASERGTRVHEACEFIDLVWL